MKERVEKIIADVTAAHSDKRLHLLAVHIAACDAATVKLSGKVLESANLQAIVEKLPGVKVDASAVQVLRREPATIRYVATNLTNLHREPSWISELMTQFTNGTPLEILEEQERWAFVRMADGYLGWAYKPYLTHAASTVSPTHLAHLTATLFKQPEPGAQATTLPIGTAVHVMETNDSWMRVRVCAGEQVPSGWINRLFLTELRPLPMPATKAAQEMISRARGLTGTYYLWGGRSSWGIDCSGLCQLVHQLAGYTIPRDADLQFAAGKPVEPPYQAGDLMFFGGEPAAHAPRKITHVGLSLGGWRIIHSSRSNNGVYEDDIQAVDHLRTTFCGARTFIR